MDYENLYKNALDRARIWKEKSGMPADKQGILDDIFPELKESEDERIRKGLINYFNHHKNGINIFYGIKGDDILAWLEKQGESSDQIHYWTEEEIEPIISDYLRGAEHYGGMIGRLRCLKPKSLEKQGETYTKRDVDDAWLKGMCDAKRELEKQNDSPIKWNKNTKDCKPKVSHSVLMKTTHGIAEGEWQVEHWRQYRWSCTVKDDDVLYWIYLSDLYSTMPYAFEKQSEQKSQRMISAEAKEAMYDKPADKVEPKFKVKYAGSEYNVLEVKDVAGVTYYGIEDEPNHIDYVKAENCEIIDGYAIKENGSPYPTKSAVFFGAKEHAWSEKDEMSLEDSMRAIKCSNYFDFESAKENVLNWLKTLKDRVQPQNTWKPSDEQMADLWNMLCECRPADHQLLQDIYYGLKKLR